MCLLIFLVPQNTDAQSKKRPRDVFVLEVDASYEPPFQPILRSTYIIIDDDNVRPVEPSFAEVEYKRNTPFNSIEDRVSRLAHGVSKNIPPEFDHYGHEVRKYMAYVGNDRIFEDEEFLRKQIKSVKKARVVLEYWVDYLSEEQKKVEEILLNETVSATARTKHKQNKAQLKTFMVVIKSWIDANERYLTFIFQHFDVLELDYPQILVLESRYKTELYNLLAFKQQKLKELKEFKPFEMMVY